MSTPNVSKVVGGLMFFTAILGAAVLAFDGVLPTGAPVHYYALAFFVIVDFAVGILVVARPSKQAYSFVICWCLLRIFLQVADITQASMYHFSSYGQFADYLFNPVSAVSSSLGNPPGIPGLPIDFILILELAALILAWKLRSNPN